MLRFSHIPAVAAAVSLSALFMCACIPNTHTYSDDDYSEYDYDTVSSDSYTESTEADEAVPVEESMSEQEVEFYTLLRRADEIMKLLENCVSYGDYSDWDTLVEDFNATHDELMQAFDSSDYDQSQAIAALDRRIDHVNEAVTAEPAEAETEAETDSTQVYY